MSKGSSVLDAKLAGQDVDLIPPIPLPVASLGVSHVGDSSSIKSSVQPLMDDLKLPQSSAASKSSQRNQGIVLRKPGVTRKEARDQNPRKLE